MVVLPVSVVLNIKGQQYSYNSTWFKVKKLDILSREFKMAFRINNNNFPKHPSTKLTSYFKLLFFFVRQ